MLVLTQRHQSLSPHGTQMNLRRFHLGMAMVNKQLSSGAPYLRVD